MDAFYIFALTLDYVRVRFVVNAFTAEEARAIASAHPSHREEIIIAAIRLST